MTRYNKFENLKYHFKDNAIYYFFVLIVAALGIGVGLYISLTGYKYTALLSSADRNMFAYITGTASYSSIFYSRLIDILICFLIVFLLTLIKHTAVLSYLFLGYQMTLIVLSSAAIISLYGISGIFNVILFVVPINLANFIALAFAMVVNLERATTLSKYRLKFFESFKENDYWFKQGLSVVLLVLICALNSLILPIFIKSFVVVNY